MTAVSTRHHALAAALSACVASGLFSATPTDAQIFRGCSAEIVARILPFQSGTGEIPHAVIALMDASGQCDRRSQANTCRDRASRRMTSCAATLWHTNDGANLPWECTPEFRSSTRMNSFYWGDIIPSLRADQFNDLQTRVDHYACCQRNNFGSVAVDVSLVRHGDQNCLGTGRFDVPAIEFGGNSSSYIAQCQQARANGLCGVAEGPAPSEPDPTRASPDPDPTRANPDQDPPRSNPDRDPPGIGGDGDLRIEIAPPGQ